MADLSQFSTVAQAAAFMGIAERTLYDLIRAGRIGCVRISERVIRIRREQIMEFIAEKTQARTE